MSRSDSLGATANPDPGQMANAFRDALSRLASGVAVASCWEGQTPRGLLVSSLIGLSPEPPRVLFCVAKTATSHRAFLAAESCGLSVLADAQARDARAFARSDQTAQRFTSGGWRLDYPRPPRLADALATFEATIAERRDAGTHTILIAEVSALAVADGAPLLYFRRAFRSLAPAGDLAPPD